MTEAAERFFELRLLKAAGFEPVLDRCVTCGAPLEGIASPRFDCREGGIRCARCAVNSPDFIPVSAGTLRTLLMGRDIDFERMPRVALSGPWRGKAGRSSAASSATSRAASSSP